MRLYEFISESINVEENLKKWFKDKWVRFGPDGKIRGDCARGDSSEGKPKCLPRSKAQALGKKGRASSAAKKRREDPNPERRGAAKNVATKVKEDTVLETLQQLGSDEVRKIQHMLNVKYNANLDVDGELGPLTVKSIKQFLPSASKGPAPNPEKTTAVQGSQSKLDEKCWKGYHKEGNKKMFGKTVPNCVKNEGVAEGVPFDQCPQCGGKIVHESQLNEKQDACYHKVKSRYKVWPSAYASGALVQCRKKGAANWGNSTKESIEENFADGKNPQDKGDSARHGIPKGATMAQLEKAAKAPGRKGQLARWQINMRRGKKK
jgi:peptidoglycan hydrolase-like protein with peptidoglycan-binding domain